VKLTSFFSSLMVVLLVAVFWGCSDNISAPSEPIAMTKQDSAKWAKSEYEKRGDFLYPHNRNPFLWPGLTITYVSDSVSSIKIVYNGVIIYESNFPNTKIETGETTNGRRVLLVSNSTPSIGYPLDGALFVDWKKISLPVVGIEHAKQIDDILIIKAIIGSRYAKYYWVLYNLKTGVINDLGPIDE